MATPSGRLQSHIEDMLNEATEEQLMTEYYQTLRRIAWVQQWLCKQGKYDAAWRYGYERHKREGK